MTGVRDRESETIFALASGPGRAGIAVVRLSGPRADEVLLKLSNAPLPPPRQAVLREVASPDRGLIDRALVLRFSAGASYTGEPVVELHLHGGRAVQMAVLEELAQQPGCRIAEPGEFTLRAFEAGRMDLVEVEALGDLLAAETEAQRRQAARGLDGGLRRQANLWRDLLLRAAALVEVTIDWADEEVPEDVTPEVRDILGELRGAITRELALSAGAERLRHGFEVAILGAPNSGKSSLFNALAGYDAAITSPQAGTTRDILELRYDLGGLPVIFLDTAGLRESAGDIESIGIERAKRRAGGAELRLFLRCAGVGPAESEAGLWQAGDLRVWSKADLGGGEADVAVSARDGSGVERLLDLVKERLSDRVPGMGLVSHQRQRQMLERAVLALEAAERALTQAGPEVVAEEIRTAGRALESLIGRVGTEAVLSAVFSTFCLGK